MVLYKATSPSGKIYIGITSKTLKMRQNQHFIACFKKQLKSRFYSALRKYGWNSFQWEILIKAESWEKLCELEKEFIKNFRTFDKNFGYNMTLGGEGVLGRTLSEEAKAKISKANSGKKGIIITEKHSRILSERMIGAKNPNFEGKKRLGKKLSEESKKNFKWSEERKNKLALQKGGKPFRVFENSSFIGIWVSQRQCAKDLKLRSNGPYVCLTGLQKSIKNFRFEYV
jgi:group I intron endonuclease